MEAPHPLAAFRLLADRLSVAFTDPFSYMGTVEDALSKLREPIAADADVVSVLVDLGVKAATVGALAISTRLIDRALAIAVGDPHTYCLRPRGLRAVDPAELRAEQRAAFAALASRRAELAAFSAAAAAAAPASDEGAGLEGALDNGELDALRGARLALALLDGAPSEEADAWSRAFDILWGGAAIETSASDPPLVRAAAAIAGAGGLESLVDPRARSWGDAWAPTGLFAELGAPAAVALLSPSAAVTMPRERVTKLVRALLSTLDRFADVRQQRAVLAGNLVRFAFGARAPRWPERNRDVTIPEASALDALEREILVAVAEKVSPFQWEYEVHHALFAVGLPATWDGLRRWLGLDPPSAMEAVVAVRVRDESRPLGIGVAFGRLLAGEVEPHELARAMARDLPAAILIDLADAGLRPFDYRLHCTGPARSDAERLAIIVAVLVLALETRGLAELHDALLAAADRAVFHGRGIDPQPSAILMALSRSLAARGEILPARFDLLVATLMTDTQPDHATARALLATLPGERRDALVLRARRAVSLFAKPDYDDCLSQAARQQLAKIGER